MSQVYPLDNLIKKLDCDNLPPVSSSETVVFINANTGEVLPKKPSFWHRIGLDLRCYLVTKKSAEVNVPDCPTCQVKDDNRAITLNVTYTASCKSGNENNIVETLFDRANRPFVVLEQLIKQWVQEFVRVNNGPTRFIDGYFHGLKEQLETHLNGEAEKIGLTLEVKLSLENEDDIKLIHLPIQFFPVRVKDSGGSDEFGLKITDALLEVNEDKKINIVAKRQDIQQLEQLFKDQIDMFLRENTTWHEFRFHLDTLRDKLIEHLNTQVLLSKGRKMTSLFLESNVDKSHLPEESPLFHHEIECKIKDCSTPIVVKHDVLMSLDDLGKYKKARIDDLEVWLKKTIEKVTQATLLEKSYADLVMGLDTEHPEITQEIRKSVEQKANSIGYSVKHLVVIPDLEPFILKQRGIYFEQEGVFTTKDARVDDAKLNIVVKAEIRNFEGLKAYLNPGINILDEIKQVVIECARLLIHHIDPERFYLRFFSSDVPEEVSVAQELTKEISQRLKETFGLENIQVTPKQLEASLPKRFKDLQQGYHDFKVITLPKREGGGGESVVLTGQFQVFAFTEGGWCTFQTNDYKSTKDEIDAIRNRLQKQIESQLEMIPNIHLTYTDQKIKNEIDKHVKSSAETIGNEFGLAIKTSSLSRSFTKTEEAMYDARQKLLQMQEEKRETEQMMADMLNKASLDKLNVLLEMERKLIAAESDEDDLKKVRQQIEDIRKTVASNTQLQQGTSPSPSEFNFDEYWNLINSDARAPIKKIRKDTTTEQEDVK